MRRLVVFTVLAIGLAIPAAGFALVAGPEDGTLSIKAGIGKATLSPFNGSVVGRIAHGSIRANDPIAADGAGIDIWGCDYQDTRDTTTLCRGTNIRFRAIDGKYGITIRGSGIYLSAVGRGTVTLDGRGEDPDVEKDGVFSLNGASYKSLPNASASYSLLSPVGG